MRKILMTKPANQPTTKPITQRDPAAPRNVKFYGGDVDEGFRFLVNGHKIVPVAAEDAIETAMMVLAFVLEFGDPGRLSPKDRKVLASILIGDAHYSRQHEITKRYDAGEISRNEAKRLGREVLAQNLTELEDLVGAGVWRGRREETTYHPRRGDPLAGMFMMGGDAE
jgi:hypothetical protein